MLSTVEMRQAPRGCSEFLVLEFWKEHCSPLLVTSYLEGEEQPVFRNVSVDSHVTKLIFAVMKVFHTSDCGFRKVMMLQNMTLCRCKNNNHNTTKTLFCYLRTRHNDCIIVI